MGKNNVIMARRKAAAAPGNYEPPVRYTPVD